MSIGGLSEHLCLVVEIVISLLVASSIFQTTCATTNSYDFSNSRQLKRNLAVSKHRNNTHWLPNYTWKPPEKFHGPRKRPAWEVDQVTESEQEKKEREEREEWEEKMREVTRLEREKWKTYEDEERSQPVTPDQLSMPSADILKHDGGITESKVSFDDKLKNQRDDSIVLNNNLHNGRWGMSFEEPVAGGFFDNAPKTSDSSLKSPSHEETTLATIFSNGRWGMNVKEVPKEFLEEMSAKSEVQRSNGSSKRDDDQTTGDQWGNENGGIASKSFGETIEHQSSVGQSDVLGQSINSSNIEKYQTVPVTFPTNRWGIDVKEPPKEFLKEMSRRSFKMPGEPLNWDEDRTRVENGKFDSAEEDREMKRNTGMERASAKLSNGRWGMSESSAPGEFQREISRRGHVGMAGFYKPETSQQLIPDGTPRNDPRSRKLIFLRTPSTSNVLFPRSLPGILGVPMFLRYLMNPRDFRNSGTHNFPRIRCVICEY